MDELDDSNFQNSDSAQLNDWGESKQIDIVTCLRFFVLK